jgi:hypothetical protein
VEFWNLGVLGEKEGRQLQGLQMNKDVIGVKVERELSRIEPGDTTQVRGAFDSLIKAGASPGRY